MSADGGSSNFVRRMSALARKGRSRRRESGSSPVAGASAGGVDGGGASPAVAATNAAAAATFVNEGLERWNAQHKEWCAGRSGARSQATARRRRAHNWNPSGPSAEAAGAPEGGAGADAQDPGFDSDDLYNELINPAYTPFPKRVMLSKLVEVLVDVWESDGT